MHNMRKSTSRQYDKPNCTITTRNQSVLKRINANTHSHQCVNQARHTGVTGVMHHGQMGQHRRVPGAKSRLERITKTNRDAVETYDDFVITLKHFRLRPNSNKKTQQTFYRKLIIRDILLSSAHRQHFVYLVRSCENQPSHEEKLNSVHMQAAQSWAFHLENHYHVVTPPSLPCDHNGQANP